MLDHADLFVIPSCFKIPGYSEHYVSATSLSRGKHLLCELLKGYTLLFGPVSQEELGT